MIITITDYKKIPWCFCGIRGFFFSLRKEEGDEGDGDDAANRGDERHLGDERRIAAVFQTEHRAETRYWHRNDNRIDVVDQIAYPT